MTKETKIGLLVGLAFIILFAIILSEKGTTHRDTTAPAFTVVDQLKGSTPVANSNSQPLADAGKLPVESQLPLIIGPSPKTAESLMEEEQIAEAPSTEEEPLQPLPSTLAELLKSPNSAFEEATPTRQVAPPDTETRKEEPVLVLNETKPAVGTEQPPTVTKDEPLPSLVQDEIASRTESKPPVSEMKPIVAPPKPVDKVAEAAPSQPMRIRTEHTVQPGESIGKIAAKYYGRSSPARVAAIFDSNREVLKSVQSVRAGDKLRIPDLGPQFEPAPSFALTKMTKEAPIGLDSGIRIPAPLSDKTNPVGVKSSKPAAAGLASTKTVQLKEPNYQWYEIRKADTLSRIAKRVLGSERLVKDICQLNRDLISNKHVLKPGMKIRIPTRSSTAANTAGQPMLSLSGADQP